jgi:hypothetical protein
MALRLLDDLHDVCVRLTGHRFTVDADYAVASTETSYASRTVLPDVFHKYCVHRFVRIGASALSQTQPFVSGQHQIRFGWINDEMAQRETESIF